MSEQHPSMPNGQMMQPYADDEIDLKELFGVLWVGKLHIIALTIVAAVISVAVALMMPNIYRSEALLSPVSGDKGGMASLASKFGGLASLAGVSLGGGGGGDKTALGMQVIKSREFFKHFSDSRDVLPPLMAVESWNSNSGEIEYDAEVYNMQTNTWLREVDPPKQPKPSVQEAHEEFLKILSVSQDKESGFVTIAIEHQSPIIAQQWVTWLVDDINTTIRDQDVQQAERSIAYLKEQIASTALTELQAGFFEMIQSQTETIMLAKASPEYLFKTIDPAVVPELKAKPNRALICVLGTMLGGMLGVLIVLVRHYAFKKEEA
jgi:uncharacterized protein involved in exopolysaccharide biosynthesis